MDIFDNVILCSKCGKKMKPKEIIKDGFILRAVQCPKCEAIVIHPSDLREHEQFNELRNKTFRVKMRLVGNSYAVSIPKQIVEFIREQEKIMNDMVSMCFEEAGKLSLMFSEKIKDRRDDE